MFSLDLNGESYFDSYENSFGEYQFSSSTEYWKIYYTRLEAFRCYPVGYRGGAVIIRHLDTGKTVMLPRTLVRNDDGHNFLHTKVGLRLLVQNFYKVGVCLKV